MEFEQLIQQPESLRGDPWEQDFLRQFGSLKVQIESEDVQQGPDGWPYLFARTGAQATELVTDVMSWLARRGIGLVVNPHKMLPDYIFPYGMVWNFVASGRFLQPVGDPGPTGEVIYEQNGLLMGPPSEKYLPPYVRAVLREFLHSRGFHHPKILVVSSPDYRKVDLLFSVDALSGLTPAQHQPLAEMLAWFLPPHYSLVLGEEKDFPPFSDL